MKCSVVTLIFLLAFYTQLSNTYTITNVIPKVPTQKVVEDTLVRSLPDGEQIKIICTKNTVFNKETLTCDYNEEGDNVFFSVLPADDCRKFKLCDGNNCSIMNCPVNTLFNVKTKSCDYPNKVNCCEFDALNSSRILGNNAI